MANVHHSGDAIHIWCTYAINPVLRSSGLDGAGDDVLSQL